jgi:hypothetical protein
MGKTTRHAVAARITCFFYKDSKITGIFFFLITEWNIFGKTCHNSYMIKPSYVQPTDETKTVAKLFSTRLVVKGNTWFPFTQIITWLLLSYLARKRLPQRSLIQSLGIGAVSMPLVLGSEWGHNLAHAAFAHWIGKPVDAIRIVWGMPLLVYYDVNDQQVAPKQHIVRAIGGPVFNLTLLPFTILLKQLSKKDSFLKDMGNFLFATNAFIGIGGFLPIPGVDGGPILKWSLVENGCTIEEADDTVRKVNGVLGAGFVAGTFLSAKRKRWVWTGICGMFALTALGIATGLLKEQR